MLLDSINDEWSAVCYNEETDKEIHCQLCGRINKKIYYIHNKLNDNELNVGSECIKKFPKLENRKNVKKSFIQQNKIHEEQIRRVVPCKCKWHLLDL